jgi:hypothetical protein
MNEPTTTAIVPSGLGTLTPSGRQKSSRPGVVRVAAFTIATLASFPVALLLTMTGIGVIALVVPAVLAVAAARINASLFYPELIVSLPPEPLALNGDGDVVITIGPGRDVFDRLAVKASVTYHDADHEFQVSSHTALDVHRPAPGTTHRVPIRDVLGKIQARRVHRAATYTMRIQGYVARLPDAVIDIEVRTL